MNRLRERGFSAVEGIMIVLVLAALIGIAWFAYDRMQDNDAKNTTTTQSSNADATTAPQVNDTEDLDTAGKALDDTNLDASTSDSGELDTQTGAF